MDLEFLIGLQFMCKYVQIHHAPSSLLGCFCHSGDFLCVLPLFIYEVLEGMIFLEIGIKIRLSIMTFPTFSETYSVYHEASTSCTFQCSWLLQKSKTGIYFKPKLQIICTCTSRTSLNLV